ncbi:MAG: NAD-dependent epimerase/dehydratase family protein [Pseudomonadota bacterium]
MAGRVLVVGGGNQIAAFLIPQLLAAGHQVGVQSRRPAPPWIVPHPELSWSTAGGTPAADRSVEYEALVYLAPLTQFEERWRGLAGITRVVAFSSTSRMAKQASADAAERAVAELLADGEAVLQRCTAEEGASLAVLRPTLIYGAGIDQNLTRLAGFVKRWRLMPLLGEGTGRRQPVHAADLAAAAQALLERPEPLSGSFNLPGGSTLSYRSMVKRVFESLELQPRFLPLPLLAARAALPVLRRSARWRDLNPAMLDRMNQNLVYDASPAQRAFHYQPRPFRPQPATWLPLNERKGH